MLLGAVIGGAVAAASAVAESGTAVGAELYRQKCTMCHGPSGRGDGPAAANYDPPPANLADPERWRNLTREDVEDMIRNGHNQMPPMGQDRAQVEALTDYLMATFAAK
jgi:mono/diheme cytochrome c family protein